MMTQQRLDEAEQHAVTLGDALMGRAADEHSRTRRAATAIALIWSRWVPMVDAAEAANNLTTVLSMDDSDALSSALATIQHRIRHFNWPALPWRTVMRMGVLAVSQWATR